MIRGFLEFLSFFVASAVDAWHGRDQFRGGT